MLMRYRLEDIDAFLHVVEMGSISTAAVQLNLTKSVVSKRVSDLEKALGVVLLNRSTQGAAPTDEGEIFHARGRVIMQTLDDAANEVSKKGGELTGTLRVNAPMTLGTLYLGSIWASFLQYHPQLEAMLDLDDRIVDVQRAGYDMAIRVGHLQDSSLIARRLCTTRRMVCCSPDYAERVGLPASLEEITSHDCIGYSNVRSSHVWNFEPAREGEEIRSLTVRHRLVANNGDVMRDMAVAGLGLIVQPAFIVAQALADGRLIDAMPEVRPTSVPIHAVYPRTRRSSGKIKAFVAHVQAELGEEPPWEQLLST
jgi:DNA-binding transcriptional LysR family regulator